VDVRGGGAAERLLGLPGVLPQLPGGATVGVVGGLGEPAPLVGRPAGELPAEVADDRRVDVEAARVGEPLGRENVEAAGGGAPHDCRVERAGTEVVDDGRATDRQVRTDRADEVRRRRDRLGNQHRGGQAGIAAARLNASRRWAPQAAGWVSVTCAGIALATRCASVATRRNTVAISSVDRSSRSPRYTVCSSMRRFGYGSKRCGCSRAE
jgi:hypothetical protein